MKNMVVLISGLAAAISDGAIGYTIHIHKVSVPYAIGFCFLAFPLWVIALSLLNSAESKK